VPKLSFKLALLLLRGADSGCRSFRRFGDGLGALGQLALMLLLRRNGGLKLAAPRFKLVVRRPIELAAA
jgi:hypothetical protein